MEAGRLDRRVTLQRLDQAVSTSTYTPQETWANLATVWASVRPASSSRAAAGMAIVAVDDLEVQIRYRSDVDATCRVVYEERHYYVQAVQEIGRREGLRLIVSGRAEHEAQQVDP